ncbi:hypothetical protein JOF41_005434 [Saccharothrix coeruleofusca]|uniref:hypothetical protein n=1 Tax=Saccharothrix coeruleofusca TaxID=33919 RepID=UPI001AE39576|nr:hypothetical protein [Saccharothrix coeruleofusca]MBP2339256.1 hypothetical protein [Saccharothrix coeruleofusca]
MSVVLYWITPGGAHAGLNPDTNNFEEGYPGIALPGNGGIEIYSELDNYFIAMSPSGGLAGVFARDSDHQGGATMTCADFLDPGDVGPIPVPDSARPIPPDSPRVVVGCGMAQGLPNVIVREQFWRLAPDSYSIGPDETRTVSYTQTSGMESTTSEQQSLAQSLNVSATAGWGPVSASVSASLSSNTSTFQQVTLSSQQTTFVSRTLEPASEARTTLYWQLTEVITVFAKDSNDSLVPQASSITGLQPILAYAYHPDQLAEPRRRSRMTAEERERAPSVDSPGGHTRTELLQG